MRSLSAPGSVSPIAPRPAAGYIRVTSVAFWGVHVAAVIGIFQLGWSWRGVALAIASYFIRMVVVTAVHHRYFAHRAFKTSRAFQLVLALAAQSAAQKGVLWWASHHRWHHKTSDTPEDIHSARQRGFWYSHIGWVMGSDGVADGITQPPLSLRGENLLGAAARWRAISSIAPAGQAALMRCPASAAGRGTLPSRTIA